MGLLRRVALIQPWGVQELMHASSLSVTLGIPGGLDALPPNLSAVLPAISMQAL